MAVGKKLCEALPSIIAAGAIGRLAAGAEATEVKAADEIATQLEKAAPAAAKAATVDLQSAPLKYAGDLSTYQKAPKMLYQVDPGAQLSDLPKPVQNALLNNMDGVPANKIAEQVSEVSARDANRYIVVETNDQGGLGAYIPGSKQAAQFGELSDLSSSQAAAVQNNFAGVPLSQGQQAGTAQMVDVSNLGWSPGQTIVPAWGGSQTVGTDGAYAVVNSNGVVEYIVQKTGSGLPVGYIPK